MYKAYSGRAKEFLRHWRRKKVKTWHLLLLLILFSGLTIFFLRQNNIEMIRLRNVVLQADEENGDVAGALKDLNEHVFGRMNTEIVRPIELVHSYNRQADAIIKKAARPARNRDLYGEAARHCEGRGALFSEVRNQCFVNYILANNEGFGEQPNIVLPQKERFTYSFVSPLWTPDIAGISLLSSLFTAAWLLVRVAEFVIVKLVIRRRLKSGFRY